MGIRSYFKGAELARMSNGTYCIIRDLGLVKGGKGLRHFENLLTLSPKGIVSKLIEIVRRVIGLLGGPGTTGRNALDIDARAATGSRG
jgi:hypothetical protein